MDAEKRGESRGRSERVGVVGTRREEEEKRRGTDSVEGPGYRGSRWDPHGPSSRTREKKRGKTKRGERRRSGSFAVKEKKKKRVAERRAAGRKPENRDISIS